MLQEFIRNFALRGNVIDLAIGVINGGAFGKIVSSLVNDVLMPLIGALLGGVSFADLKYVISPASGDVAEVALLYGSFIQSIVDFLIIAFSVFLFVRLLSRMKKKDDVSPAPPGSPRRKRCSARRS
jgi:large conductance mechanosensitive channel